MPAAQALSKPLQSIGVPWHVPSAVQISFTVHAERSLQPEPTDRFVITQDPPSEHSPLTHGFGEVQLSS
jgi:hypothetical protein